MDPNKESQQIQEATVIEEKYRKLTEVMTRVESQIATTLLKEFNLEVVTALSDDHVSGNTFSELDDKLSDHKHNVSKTMRLIENWINKSGNFSPETETDTREEETRKLEKVFELLDQDDVHYLGRLEAEDGPVYDKITQARVDLSFLPTENELKEFTKNPEVNASVTKKLVEEYANDTDEQIATSYLMANAEIDRMPDSKEVDELRENTFEEIGHAALENKQFIQDVVLSAQKFIDGDRSEDAVSGIKALYERFSENAQSFSLSTLQTMKQALLEGDLSPNSTDITVSDIEFLQKDIQHMVHYYADYRSQWNKEKGPLIELARMKKYIEDELAKMPPQ